MEVSEKAPKYTSEELKQMLEKQEAAERRELEKKRATYESNKHQLVEALVAKASKIQMELKDFKSECVFSLNEFYKLLKAYGDVRKSNKGTFTIESEDKEMSVSYERHATFGFNELGEAAADKIKEFLEGTVKKRDARSYKIIMNLLDKTSNDEYDPRSIHKLYKLENQKEFQDERFLSAIALFKEAYVERNTAYYVRFSVRNEEGKLEALNLNWSSI